MQIESRASYLVLHSEPASFTKTISIFPNLPAVLEAWKPGTRISPIWAAKEFCSKEPASFPGERELVFLGPVAPALVETELGATLRAAAPEVWVTPGCFNVLISSPIGDRCVAEPVAKWAKKCNIPYERWKVGDGKIAKRSAFVLDSGIASDALARLGALAKKNFEPALAPTIQEYLVLTASTLTRAAAMRPHLFHIIEDVGRTVDHLINAYSNNELSALNLNSRLLNLNAALSRFASQTFSGIPPIESTECHFWIHSLLGTGSANIALDRLAGWVQHILGEARLPERISKLAEISGDTPSLEALLEDHSHLDFDLLKHVRIDAAPPKVFPLITYFSGRDGFSSHSQTLSAPITTLAECNSHRSSLLTVTHEISHVFVEAILHRLYPRVGDEADIARFASMVLPGFKAGSTLESVRQLLAEAIISMEHAARGDRIATASLAKELPSAVLQWGPESREILVHAFDYLYFYASEPRYYIESIWHSWSAIPGIQDRIPGYVMRTLCAVSAGLLREKPVTRFEAALREVREVLHNLDKSGTLMANYVHDAVAYIDAMNSDPAKRRELKREYDARMYLVRLVRIFLYSESLAAALYQDPYAAGGTRGDDKKWLVYDTTPIGNPLRFLRDRLKFDPSEGESMWVLHSLAFDSPD